MAFFKDTLAKVLNRKKTLNGPETAIQEYQAVIDFTNLFAYVVGIEFTSDWKYNSRAILNMIMNLLLVWDQFYTWYELFPSIACVELTAGMIVFISIQTKFAFFVFNHVRFMSLVDFIYEVANRSTDGDRKRIMIDVTKTIFYHFKLVFGGFCCGASVYMFYPFYDYFVNGKLTPMSPLMFPFAKDDSLRSYWIGMFCNIVPPFWNVFGVAATSCLFMTCVDVYAGLVSLIENDLSEFNGMWTKGYKNNKLRHAVFRNIMMEIMDLARYNAMMKDLFSLLATVEVGCSFFGIAALIFAMLANDYYGGLGGIVYFSSGLMMFCFIGQLMYDQTKRIQMVVFGTDWYLYDCRYQSDVMFALYIVQNMKSVTVANIIPLNFQTGVTVAKNIYSILMFLLNALE